MVFNSLAFIVFILAFLSVYFFLPHRPRNWFLILGSIFFYGWWDYRFLLLVVISAVVDFVAAIRIDKNTVPSVRKRWLILSILTNLGILGYFKYCNFFIDSACTALSAVGLQPNVPTLSIILPVGISFYTFQTMSYTIDVYRGKLKANYDFLDHFLYVIFFPQLVAGPIERAKTLLPQIQNPRTITRADLSQGFVLIVIGFFKKVAVADMLAPVVDRGFSNPESTWPATLLLCLYCFCFQIYADFSGYSDIARGISQIMGFRLMINFEQPYFSASITEFWQRWHISLSTWLRDYLYIPLGGNRHGALITYRNLFLTMILGGLWHGASWNFVVWGLLHGVYLSIHKAYFGLKKRIVGTKVEGQLNAAVEFSGSDIVASRKAA